MDTVIEAASRHPLLLAREFAGAGALAVLLLAGLALPALV